MLSVCPSIIQRESPVVLIAAAMPLSTGYEIGSSSVRFVRNCTRNTSWSALSMGGSCTVSTRTIRTVSTRTGARAVRTVSTRTIVVGLQAGHGTDTTSGPWPPVKNESPIRPSGAQVVLLFMPTSR